MKLQLIRLRKRAGNKTRESIAAALGTSEHRNKSIEAGEVRLILEEACYIADFFNCTLDELAGRSFSLKEYRAPCRPRSTGATRTLPSRTGTACSSPRGTPRSRRERQPNVMAFEARE